MSSFISVLIIIACVFLVLVILIQNPKGGGLASGFGAANQLGGVRKTTDFLEKTTWYLTIGIVILSIVSTSFKKQTGANVTDVNPVTILPDNVSGLNSVDAVLNNTEEGKNNPK